MHFRKSHDRRKHRTTTQKTLDETYKKLLNRIIEEEDVKTAFQILSSLLYAQRPLKKEELSEALAIEPRESKIGERISTTDIVECSHGLVVWGSSSETIWICARDCQRVYFPKLTQRKLPIPLCQQPFFGNMLQRNCVFKAKGK